MNEGEDQLHPWIDPELGASIVALTLGEASDFESEKLERLLEERPELAVYRDRMWVLGGWSNNPSKNWPDVWYSKDGKDWRQLTSDVIWKERHEHVQRFLHERRPDMQALEQRLESLKKRLAELEERLEAGTEGN